MIIRASVLLLFLAPFAASAADPASKPDVRAVIAKKFPGVKPEDVRASPIPGMYEVVDGSDILYFSADGKYVIAGDLYDVDSNKNLTDSARRAMRLKLLATMPESQMLVFAPKTPKYVVTVFTDIDCPYCRKLHSEIAEYNRLGISVRYLLYPRSGPDTDSWDKAEQVWCSTDRNDAFTRVKRGEKLSAPKECKSSVVGRQYELGRKMGIKGTPAIIAANGQLFGGYLPPDMLVEELRRN